MRRALQSLAFVSLVGFIVAGCPGPSGAGGTDPQQAADSVKSSVQRFVSGTPTTAAEEVETSLGVLFEAYSDVGAGLDAALVNVLGWVTTSAAMQSLVEKSAALNGREVDAGLTGGAQSKLAAPMPQAVNGARDPEPVVLFINGINNTHAEFVSSLEALRKLLTPLATVVRVEGYYNVSGRDREYYRFGTFARPIDHARAVALAQAPEPGDNGALGVGFDLAEAGMQGLEDWVRILPSDADATEFADLIRRRIDNGHTVIIVAHSQGNYMARQALTYLVEAEGEERPPVDSIGVISVGSPTSSFATSPPHTIAIMMTGEVMDRLALGSWNANVPIQERQRSDNMVALHSFNSSYLRNSVARDMIYEGVERLAEDLTNTRRSVQFTGRVVDANTNEPIAGARVALTVGVFKEDVQTNSNGEFTSTRVRTAAGETSYSLLVSHPDYRDLTQSGTTRSQDKRPTIRLELRLGADLSLPRNLVLTPPGAGATGEGSAKVEAGSTVRATWEGGTPAFQVLYRWTPGGAGFTTVNAPARAAEIPVPSTYSADQSVMLEVTVKDAAGVSHSKFATYMVAVVRGVSNLVLTPPGAGYNGTDVVSIAPGDVLTLTWTGSSSSYKVEASWYGQATVLQEGSVTSGTARITVPSVYPIGTDNIVMAEFSVYDGTGLGRSIDVTFRFP